MKEIPKTITSVFFDTNKNNMSIVVDQYYKSPHTITLALTGDCCSDSFFEEQSAVDAKSLVGQRLLNIEQVSSKLPDQQDVDDWKAIAYHAVKITTDQQELVLDWRNESNGYYDGVCHIQGWPLPKEEK